MVEKPGHFGNFFFFHIACVLADPAFVSIMDFFQLLEGNAWSLIMKLLNIQYFAD